MKHLRTLVAAAIVLAYANHASAISVHMSNCDWTQQTELWNAGCGPVNTCERFDGPATVVDQGTLSTAYGTEMCCRRCYKAADANGPEVCCTGAGSKTCEISTSVTDQTTWNVSLAVERKVGASGSIEIVEISVETTLKGEWGYSSSQSRTLTFTGSATVAECRYVCDKGTMEVRNNKKVEITHTYKVKRQSAHYGDDGAVCSCWTPCYENAGTKKSTGTGTFQTGNASSDLSGNGACGDPAGACGKS